jgi:hypothetical protein
LAADPGYQGSTQAIFEKKSGRRSQRQSADVTNKIGTIAIEQGFQMQEELNQKAYLQFVSAAKSEQKKKRK